MTKVLKSAPVPWHSKVLMVVVVLGLLATLPSWEQAKAATTIETFTRVLFPQYVNLPVVVGLRGLMALVIWAVTLEMVLLCPGWTKQTSYKRGSQLQAAPVPMKGIKTTLAFTSVIWILLGWAFSLSWWIGWQGMQDRAVSPWILRLTLALWEMAAPNSVLVAAVVRYVIWPGSLAKGKSTRSLQSWRNVFMHNLNVLFVAMETAVLGGLPVRLSELSLAPLVGCAYVVFSWCMANHWTEPQYGPQFLYNFLDPTLPGYYTHSLVILALLVALIGCYTLFCAGEALLVWANGAPAASCLFVAALCASVMRFRD